MEGVFFQESQYDSYCEFDVNDNMVVPDSLVVADEEVVMSAEEKPISEEIVEDTYERDEKDSTVLENVGGQEESSVVKLSEYDSRTGLSDSEEKGRTPLIRRGYVIGNGVKRKRKENPLSEFDLNELPPADDGEDKPVRGLVHEDRDFDLNKLPTAGMWDFTDVVDERTFILMLRILVPGFH